VAVKKNTNPGFLRIITSLVLLAGAGVSLWLMLYTGRNNKSVLLILLFAGWVLSPFIAMLTANIISKSWPVPTRLTLYILILLLTIGSLLGYSGVLSPQGTKPAFVFLVVPLISWLLIAIIIPIARARARKTQGSDNNV
jgi:hypothetical protein